MFPENNQPSIDFLINIFIIAMPNKLFSPHHKKWASKGLFIIFSFLCILLFFCFTQLQETGSNLFFSPFSAFYVWKAF